MISREHKRSERRYGYVRVQNEMIIRWLAEMLAIFRVFMELLLYKSKWKIAEDIDSFDKKIHISNRNREQ